jgi:hypothetical protein
MSLNPAPYNDSAVKTAKPTKNKIQKQIMELFETNEPTGYEHPKLTKTKQTDILEDEDEAFDEFKPLPISQTRRAIQNHIVKEEPKKYDPNINDDEDVTHEQFTSLNHKVPQTSYKQAYQEHIPYYTQQANYNEQQTQLLQRVNYLVHLLEEQQEEKTDNVVEELILYSFLGIFTIFMVDSFTRVGKYSR